MKIVNNVLNPSIDAIFLIKTCAPPILGQYVRLLLSSNNNSSHKAKLTSIVNIIKSQHDLFLFNVLIRNY